MSKFLRRLSFVEFSSSSSTSSPSSPPPSPVAAAAFSVVAAFFGSPFSFPIVLSMNSSDGVPARPRQARPKPLPPISSARLAFLSARFSATSIERSFFTTSSLRSSAGLVRWRGYVFTSTGFSKPTSLISCASIESQHSARIFSVMYSFARFSHFICSFVSLTASSPAFMYASFASVSITNSIRSSFSISGTSSLASSTFWKRSFKSSSLARSSPFSLCSPSICSTPFVASSLSTKVGSSCDSMPGSSSDEVKCMRAGSSTVRSFFDDAPTSTGPIPKLDDATNGVGDESLSKASLVPPSNPATFHIDTVPSLAPQNTKRACGVPLKIGAQWRHDIPPTKGS
mmetsp:Transcript_26337/g.67098  ORF Transcript_26337/g.67098 Transcript_26337/m.67098 type:complete len:342 (-) Transcript_26337:2327-3352(-)